MPKHLIYFVRHGETHWNAEKRLQGQTDTPLNDTGRGQAKRNGETLAGVLAGLSREAVSLEQRFDFVASPLSRATETMEIIRAELGLPRAGFRTDPRLKEMSYGSWEGQLWPRHRTDRTPEIEHWLADPWTRRPGGGESYAMLCERVVAWLGELAQDTVVVAHGGVMRVLRGHILKLPPAEIIRLDVPQDRVLLLHAGSERWVVSRRCH